MPNRVVIVGAGEIGSAVAALVKTSGAKIERWDKDASKVPTQRDLDAIVHNTDVLFFCLPSWHMRDAAASVAPLLRKKTIVVTVANGMELRSRKTMDALLTDLLPRGQAVALLYGPMLAEELDLGLMGAAVVATKRRAAYDAIRKLFAKSRLRLEHSADVRGTALCGVLKNVYAISLGIVSALEMGGNAKGWFIQQIVSEMTCVLKRLNKGRGEAALGPAGLGDLVCTGFSGYSSNHRVGRELVEGRGITKLSEGFVSLPPLLRSLGPSASRFPLLMTIKRVVIGKKNAKREFERFVRG